MKIRTLKEFKAHSNNPHILSIKYLEKNLEKNLDKFKLIRKQNINI